MEFPWFTLVFIAIIGIVLIYLAAQFDRRNNIIKPLAMPNKTKCNPPQNWQKLCHDASIFPIILATKDFPIYRDKYLGKSYWWLGTNVEAFVLNQEIPNERLWLTFVQEAKANETVIAVIAPSWNPAILDLCVANANAGNCVILPLLPNPETWTSSTDNNPEELADSYPYATAKIAKLFGIQITTLPDLAAKYLPPPKILNFIAVSPDEDSRITS